MGFFTILLLFCVVCYVICHGGVIIYDFMHTGFQGRPSKADRKWIHKFFFKRHKVFVVQEQVNDNKAEYVIMRKNWIFPAKKNNDYYSNTDRKEYIITKANSVLQEEQYAYDTRFGKRVSVVHEITPK